MSSKSTKIIVRNCLLYDYSCGGSWVFSSMGNTHAVYLWGWSAPKGHPQPHRLTQINVLYSVL